MKSKNISAILVCYFMVFPGYAGIFNELNKNNKLKRKTDCLSELSEYSDFEYQAPKTVSKTVQMFAKNKQGKDVFLKIYTASEPLNIEGTIYNNHIRYLREKNITPNLVEGIDFFICDNANPEVKNKLKELARLTSSQSGYLDKTLGNELPISFIVTERIGTADNAPETLKSYMTKFLYEVNKDDVEKIVQEVRAIFFQFIYTYDVMKKIGLFHGDLHSNNIMLEHKPIDAVYELADGTKHHVKSNYTVKIFDFDKSSVIKDLSNIDNRLFSITCATCDPPRRTNYRENGLEITDFSSDMEMNMSNELKYKNQLLVPDFLRIYNILIFGSDKNKEGNFWDEICKEGTKDRVTPFWEEEIPSDFNSRLQKLIAPTEELKSDYKALIQ